MKILLITLLALASFSTFAESIDSNYVANCSISKSNSPKAQTLFNQAALKILDVNNWASFIGIPGQKFQLYSGKAKLNRLAAKGDLIRIILPLDPTKRSYWVKIESLKRIPLKDGDKVSVVVRPTANPFKNRKGTDITDHFFTNEATNSFTVTLKGLKITSQVSGRKEFANTYQVATEIDGIANYTIAQMSWGLDSKDNIGSLQALIWRKLNKQIAVCH
jgi:hypothetical protein